MADDPPPSLRLPADAAVGGAPVMVAAAGADLALLITAGRQFAQAHMTIKAGTIVPAVLKPIMTVTDTGPFTAGGTTAVRWVAIDLGPECVLTGVKIDTDATNANAAARVRLMSQGNWVPLAPIDTVALSKAQALPNVTGSRVMAELLLPGTATAGMPPIWLPGAAPVSGVSVTGTNQPCHVSVAIAGDPPFFTHSGPLPTSEVHIEGLARAANRYLLDNPTAPNVPLKLTAGGPAPVVIAAFDATLAPPRSAVGTGATGADGPVPPRETIYLQPRAAPTITRGQLCDAAHSVAQKFDKLPAGRLLSSLDIYLRPGTSPLAGTLSIHPDDNGVPASKPLHGGTIPFILPPESLGTASWAAVLPAKPIATPDGPWWLVCEGIQGECMWFTATPAPIGAGETRSRVPGAAWGIAPATVLPAQDGSRAWAQTILRTIPGAPA